MDIFQRMVTNPTLIDELSNILRDKIRSKVTYKVTNSCIMFFMDDSIKGSLLTIVPNKDETLLQHATSPKYESFVRESIESFKTRIIREERNEKIEKIIKKES